MRIGIPTRPEEIGVPWRCALLLLGVLSLAAGCATTGAGQLDLPVGSAPHDVDEEVLEAGAVGEATLVLAQVWSVASGVHEVGANLAFSFWSERGALTLTGYSATGRPGSHGQPVDDEAFQGELAKVLTRFAQRRVGAFRLTLIRDEARWRIGFATLEGLRPLEAKTLPVRRAGLPTHVLKSVTEAVRRLSGTMALPASAHAHVRLEFSLEDERVEAWRLQRLEVEHASSSDALRKPSPAVLNEITAVLLPFTQGIGERTVLLDLSLAPSPGARQPLGWVEEAWVERPPLPTVLGTEFITEYRALHEDILRRWRENTREGAEWVARQGAEELTLWYAGGIAVRGLGWLGAKVAPTVLRVLQRGSAAATGWMRTTLTRMPRDKRSEFERLWSKVQLEGRQALSAGEREELRSLMEGIEQLIRTPLDANTKNKLRGEAREVYKRLHPHLATELDRKRGLLPIHHRRPLEHAQLFPEEDINDGANLIMLTSEVHDRINALWSKFRRARPQATAKDVEAVARTIDAQFGSWYHQAAAPLNSPHSLAKAEEKALEQLQRLFPGLE